MYLSLGLCVCLLVCLYLSLLVCLSLRLSVPLTVWHPFPVCLFVTCLFSSLSVFLPLPDCQPVYLLARLPLPVSLLSLPAFQPVCLPAILLASFPASLPASLTFCLQALILQVDPPRQSDSLPSLLTYCHSVCAYLSFLIPVCLSIFCLSARQGFP
jgi:hypothetical protein